jgi:hypothetical protein
VIITFQLLTLCLCSLARRLDCLLVLHLSQSNQIKTKSSASLDAVVPPNTASPSCPFSPSLVFAEKTSLGSAVASSRTVQFSGFDCSSTAPPVDSLFGSHQHREAEIDALSQALDQVYALRSSVENKKEIIACLQAMIEFLRVMEKSEGAGLREECSKVSEN